MREIFGMKLWSRPEYFDPRRIGTREDLQSEIQTLVLKKNNQKVDKIWGVELEFIIYSIASTPQKYKRFMLDAMAWWNASKLCPMSILGEKLKFSRKWNYRKSHFGLWYTYLSNYYMAKCFTRSFQKHKPLISKDWLTKIYTRVRY